MTFHSDNKKGQILQIFQRSYPTYRIGDLLELGLYVIMFICMSVTKAGYFDWYRFLFPIFSQSVDYITSGLSQTDQRKVLFEILFTDLRNFRPFLIFEAKVWAILLFFNFKRTSNANYKNTVLFGILIILLFFHFTPNIFLK